MSLVQIKDNKNLVRDTYSKAILSTDRAGLEDYLMKRELAKKELQEKDEMKMRLQKVEQEMSEIKSILLEIAQIKKEII